MNIETRTYEITGTPIQLNILERVLGKMEVFGNVGTSRTICIYVDGDGTARIKARRDGKRLNHDDVSYADSDAHVTTSVDGDVKADLG